MNESLEQLAEESMSRPVWNVVVQALESLLSSQLLHKLGHKYLEFGDYHWRLYYSEKKSFYQSHVNYVTSFFSDKSGRLLDVGCGDGLIMSRVKKESNLDCYGIDISMLAIWLAHYHGLKNCEVIDLMNYDGAKFDYIFFGDVLEHLGNPHAALKRSREWLADDGTLFISLPIGKASGDLFSISKELIKELVSEHFDIISLEERNRWLKIYIIAKKKLPEMVIEQEALKTNEKNPYPRRNDASN